MIQPHTVIEECARLALLGKGGTKTNPLVGSCVVRDGKVIGRGFHAEYGGPHAEIEAMADAGGDLRGADLYVTLEPCASFGKTPPCSHAIVEAGIKRVFIGVADPNPVNSGKGMQYLMEHGVEVFIGFCEEMCAGLIEDFTKHILTGMPYVTAKIAQSLDGKIATRTMDSKWITNPKSREYVHFLRSNADAVLVGVKTVEADNPILDTRLLRGGRNPMKVVLDSSLRIAEDANVVIDRPEKLTVITGEASDAAKIARLRDKGVTVLSVPSAEKGLNLTDALKSLAKLGVMNLLVEGGSTVFGSFYDSRLVDKSQIFIAPIIIGGADAVPSIGGTGAETVSEAIKAQPYSVQRFDDDMLVTCRHSNYVSHVLETTRRLSNRCSRG